MNILLTRSSSDGPFYVAFDLDSLNLELEHHKDIHDAITYLMYSKKKVTSKKFGKYIDIIHGELTDEGYFIENVLTGSGEFSDEESESYDSRYTNVTLRPPFYIYAVFTLRTFV